MKFRRVEFNAIAARMRPLVVLSLLLVTLRVVDTECLAQSRVRPKSSIILNSGWQFREVSQKEWYPATVPGSVHTDLLNNKQIEDPFYRDNEKKLQWIGKTYWIYRTDFSVTPGFLKYKNIELVFQGLDTYATVYLNNTLVLRSNNMFREWRVDCGKVFRAGKNILQVHFSSPINKVAPAMRNRDYHLPAPMDQNEKTSPYTRKAPYQFGWNWAPRLVTCGIWKPVLLEGWDQVKITNFHVLQTQVDPGTAKLLAKVELRSTSEIEAEIVVDCKSAEVKPLEKRIKIKAGENQFALDVSIKNPLLWWPNGLGNQPLYDMRARLLVSDRVIDQASTRIGLRSLELRQQPDSWGRSFHFAVNGIPFFVKGANWVPADVFPSRVTAEKYRYLIRSCRDANMNMLRVWGGGIYESEEFYDICDEMGILVWQDFMFANSLYPADQGFLDNIRQEAVDNLKRLRNHPSIALWCGNNEMETGWFHWGWKKRFPAKLWTDYKRIFYDILPSLCAANDPSRFYWPSSPSSNLEDDPDSPRMGDFHYWNIWNDGSPLEDIKKQFPRFMSEYGFQSFPQVKTINAFSLPEDHDIQSAVMMSHQKYPGGNQMIREYILRDYPEPKDFESYLYVSQVLQAEAIKIGAEHLRRIMPRCMGSLYWQINDCWPGISWAGIDYFGRWKALHYFARRFYQDVLVSSNEENGYVSIYLVSDRIRVTSAKLWIALMDFNGHSMMENRIRITLMPFSSKIHLKLPRSDLLQGRDSRKVFLNCELLVEDAPISVSQHFFESFKSLSLTTPQIDAKVTQIKGGFRITLISDRYAKNVYLSLDRYEAFFSDNYFDLLPGKKKQVDFKSPSGIKLDELGKSLKIKSLVDAF